MRLVVLAPFFACALVTLPALADVTELPPVNIVVKQHVVVTELAPPTKPLLVASPPPSFAPRVVAAVSKSAF